MVPGPITSPIAKGLGLGLSIGLLGLLIYLTPFGWGLEEHYGLTWLFHLRGSRAPPQDVVIVAIDEQSATELGLPSEPAGWPRHWYTKLVDQLSEAGAKVIVFDLFLNKAKEPEDVQVLAQAIRKAGNVALVEFLTTHVLKTDGSQEEGAIEMRIPPLPILVDASIGAAPFSLPKLPEQVNSYWTFKTTRDGDIPTLPLVAFQRYAQAAYGAYLDVLKKAEPSTAEKFTANNGIVDQITALRAFLASNTVLLKKAIDAIALIPEPRAARTVHSLFRLYGGEDVQYLDFYGPPRHITTISYHQALQAERAGVFKDAIVCIGLSESIQIKRKGDTFSTVFTQPNGLELSGVEILATAIANLVEDRPVRTPGVELSVFAIALWGLLFGLLCWVGSSRAAASIGLIVMLAYLWIAHRLFKTESLWLPLVIPLVFQSSAAFLIASVGKYRGIRRLFEYFLPKPGVKDVIKGTVAHTVNGACLAMDVEGYTSIVECMDPARVRGMLNAYHATVFPLVEHAGGFISDIVGDALLAIWHGSSPDVKMKAAGCNAVLDIANALEEFNRTRRYPLLRTRFGIHAGQFSLGVIGAPPHLEYRATGDVVNTASRIEGLNKVLGTQILISEETAAELSDRFVTRRVGDFLLAGKTMPITILELIGRHTEVTLEQELLCKSFNEAHEAYRTQNWNKARQGFLEILNIFSEDGPSRYYLSRLQSDQAKAGIEAWDGVIRIESK